ncbi:MAG TPA: hypothetical protein VFC44_06795 [Candidatus Saccharimonadales bacterium]|nr:hypothetical protein [Candidatus Saccharimonadales bacterium]
MPEKKVGPLDMKELLDLLNASEQPHAAEDAVADLSVFAAENQVVSDHAEQKLVQDEIENRFAAYIVDGMSKLMRE